jgi:hypothetical protein
MTNLTGGKVCFGHSFGVPVLLLGAVLLLEGTAHHDGLVGVHGTAKMLTSWLGRRG